MKRFGQPHVIVTDLLRSYGAAMKVIGNADRQETGRWKNNRAENSLLPFRRRERAMLRFRRTRSMQKFVSAYASVHNHFNQERHLYSRANFKFRLPQFICRICAMRNRTISRLGKSSAIQTNW